ncbi:MAG: MBL fold metallo-hydrolase [Gammaproteobacteria bacterium]|nr:MBL fold metallo-hydrolase [Gammaproteobacteria bacterium]MBT8133791.1 MBL fold metallo-hydrolase [Gammaproteobacteria bacterium]NNJ51511.1 MBL fold metallo-hydrolase [Gammaproteobacteria bacterium]
MNHYTKNTIKLFSSFCLVSTLIACSPASDNTTERPTAQSDATAKEAINSEFPYAFDKVTDNTWVMHGPRELPNPQNRGFMNNPGIVQTSAGLVMIDPGSTVQVGENVLAEVKKVSDLPIVAVFNTHIHGDHWLANQAVKASYPEVKIYGHPEMLAEIENGEGENWVNLMDSMTEGASKGTIVVAPDNAVDNSNIIEVGDTQFKIHHYGIAHTKTDIMIEVTENSVIFLGDNVLSLRIPRTSDGTFQGNISTIKTILEIDAKTYVPGHGPTGDRAMVETYLGYLTSIYEAAQKAFEDDLDSSDVIGITKETTAAYKDWQGYNDLLGPQGAQAYSEVEAAEF